MSDERDPEVSRRYRELGSEEPPARLDYSIISAARRAVEHPHAPLVTPSGRHRWYFSLGAAAVIVLAVAVTYQIQQEQPDPYAESVRQQEPAPAAAPAESPPKPAADAARPARRERRSAVPPVFVPEPPPQTQDSQRYEAQPSAPVQSSGAPAARSLAKPMQAPAAAETPEAMLERIAELRKQGKEDEADRLLADFKRRYPGYPIPENAVRP